MFRSPRRDAKLSAEPRQKTLSLSIVVVVRNMPREAPRTLLSLSAGYQRRINAADYEVVVVDDGSEPPFDPRLLEALDGNFRLIRLDQGSPSPAAAVNRGIAAAEGRVIGVMVDGARIATPGLLHFGRRAARLAGTAVVTTLGWDLGHDFQRFAVACGYDQAREDELLASIDWRRNGYRLFEIGTPDESSWEGWLQPVSESTALFMARKHWEALGGVEARLDLSGAGPVDVDIYSRALALRGAQPVVLLGEGTFRQLHGVTATDATLAEMPGRRPYKVTRPRRPPIYVGELPRPVLKGLVRAAAYPLRDRNAATFEPGFDLQLWTAQPSPRPSEPVVAALVDLARREFGAGRFGSCARIARIARGRAPDEAEPQRLLSLTAAAGEGALRHSEWIALAEAHRLVGEVDLAEADYQAALELTPNSPGAHFGLARLRLPGPPYPEWLDHFHGLLAPTTYIEIGVAKGATLRRASRPTLAIGVDPTPAIEFPLRTETHIFAETSDAFFARRGPDALLGGQPLGLAFIDGLHLFDQALRDFINLEAYCGPQSVILIHDTLPLDERTQRRSCDTHFHTGDVWKMVPCLKHFRPDLDVFTIRTSPTGLTVVTGFGQSGRTFADRYDEAVARFIDMPFAELENSMETSLDLVANSWSAVEERLEARGILPVRPSPPMPRPAAAAAPAVPGVALSRDGKVSERERGLYLDLLIKILTNTIYRDPGIQPKATDRHRPELRARGGDWPAIAHTMVGVQRLQNVRDLAQAALDENIPGDFIETGVWRGGCCILMRGVLAANGVTDRKVYVADSFAGLPPPNPELYPDDKGLDLHLFEQLAIPLEEVQDNFARYGLLDDQVVFVKGLFKDTLPTLDAGPFSLIRLDGDLYESTTDALEALYPRVSSGGFVIIDDFGAIPACRKAVMDYRARNGIIAVIRDIDGDGVWWRKP